MYATHYLLGLDGLWRLLATLPETLIFRWYVHLPLKSSRLSCLDIIVLGLPISAIMTSKELRHRFRKFRVQILNGKKQV